MAFGLGSSLLASYTCHDRVNAFISLLVGRLSVHFRGGAFQVGAGRVDFVKDGYITHHQLAHAMA